MGHRVLIGTAFAAATLFASGAYAGSPYYAQDGQLSAPAAPVRTHAPAVVSPRAAAQYKTDGVAMPKMTSDGYESPEADNSYYEHAVGTDGSQAESTALGAPETDAHPVYTAPLPKMAPDGFEAAESGSSFYSHAVGTDGSQAVAADATPAATAAQPVYTAKLPPMDPDGFETRESARSYYNHAVGTDGSP